MPSSPSVHITCVGFDLTFCICILFKYTTIMKGCTRNMIRSNNTSGGTKVPSFMVPLISVFIYVKIISLRMVKANQNMHETF